MKTYDARMESIMKKAKVKRMIRRTTKTAAVLLGFAVLLIALKMLPQAMFPSDPHNLPVLTTPKGTSHNISIVTLPTQATTPATVGNDAKVPVSISSENYLYEPLCEEYSAGDMVSVKVAYVQHTEWMLFANGQEVDVYKIEENFYWEFRFQLSDEPVYLTLHAIDTSMFDADAHAMLRAYYRQHPDAEDTQLLQYYGRYGDATVGLLQLHADAVVTQEIVGDYVFAYPTSNTILVLVDETFMRLDAAYASGYLTEADIKQIYALHTPAEKGMYLVDELPLTVQQTMKNAYISQFGKGDANSADDLSLRVMAIFGDRYALFVDGDASYLTWITGETVNGLSFRYPSSQKMYLYHAGHYYRLQEAFDAGIISDAELQQLHDNYRMNAAPMSKYAVEQLNELFGDWQSWYSRALLFEYADPSQIDLRILFYGGFQGQSREPTAEEWEQLKDQQGFNINMDLIRLPVKEMNQVLTELYGITLENVEESGFENLVYLESTQCYYHMVTDAAIIEDFNIVTAHIMNNGTIRVVYTQDDWRDDVRYEMTLVQDGDHYRILSNVIIE